MDYVLTVNVHVMLDGVALPVINVSFSNIRSVTTPISEHLLIHLSFYLAIDECSRAGIICK